MVCRFTFVLCVDCVFFASVFVSFPLFVSSRSFLVSCIVAALLRLDQVRGVAGTVWSQLCASDADALRATLALWRITVAQPAAVWLLFAVVSVPIGWHVAVRLRCVLRQPTSWRLWFIALLWSCVFWFF